jgi:glycosyltransferase involved in cell wall biosynthesis
VARLDPIKNHRLLLKAFRGAFTSREDVQLLFVGDGAERLGLEGEASRLRIQDRVHFLGFRTDIPEILGASDVFVLASNCEGNPMAVMEAMAAGLPVISTAVGAVPELVADGVHGILLLANDSEGFSGAMQHLARTPHLRRAMACRAADKAAKVFSIEHAAASYEQLYLSLRLPEKAAAARS